MTKTQTAAVLTKLDIARPETMTEQVAQRLLDYLLSGSVEPGQRIPSVTRLAEQLGVSRSSVREAVKLLESRGVLDVRQSSGCYFKGNDPNALFRTFEWALLFGTKDVAQFVEARWHIEMLLVELAAQRRSDSDVARLHGYLAAMRDSPDGEAFTRVDLDFHLAIAEAAHNVVLRDVLRGIRSLTVGWIGHNLTRATTPALAYVDHVPIFEAIVEGDSRKARAAMREHMIRATHRLAATMEPEAADAVRQRITALAALAPEGGATQPAPA
ncbi:FadR/GntR family transcriptional regulator [Chitinasiproducens palmae]|uniref:GntR family transcriptional regulator, transcriptional repressor for pyruvate dehydrogenase complex n=1 Tax=Chitinasiproducens palmae TaxID=1770053 RepID=A0A1H2PW07_9BURK|nr:FadR/GntR family transcriptional regulator [Chitinasiproducens palmae]SDV51503.1 GntR family transcriptional regulator, transcriptional repressor for pyruvate dehydrogenase complex [Chitinasiproducens palmae]